MAAVTLAEVKAYAGIVINDADSTIAFLMLAAKKYIDGKTGKLHLLDTTDIENDDLYKLAIMNLVQHWYDHHDIENPGTTSTVPHTIDAIITHITLCGDYVA